MKKTLTFGTVAALLFAAMSLIVTLSRSAFAEPGIATLSSNSILVPEGTQVHLSLLQELKSGGNKAGEDVPFEVSQDVFGPGRVLLIGANTLAYGKIQESSRRGIFGKAGKLKFTIDYILAPDKTHIPLRIDAQTVRGQDNRTTAIATAILLAPIAMFINGKDVTVKQGTAFIMYVDAATQIESPFSASSPQTIAPMTAAPAQSLFTFANGAQTVGTLLGFDGLTYTVSTPEGMRQFKKAEITSIHALASAPVVAVTGK